MGKLNLLERHGLDYLCKECTRAETALDVWGEEQLARVRSIERRALWSAAISGILSGALIAGLELILRFWLVGDLDSADWDELIPYWAVHLSLAGIITGIEILYLYRLMLRSVARMASIAGLGLANRSRDDVMANGVSRAAMDMPNPQTEFYGIDPFLRISRWQLWLYTLAYRAKVGVTSVVLRLILRRLLTRTALRSLVPFIAVPLYAVWNVVICRWTLRESRTRIGAPIAIRQLLDRLDQAPFTVGEEDWKLWVALVAEAMMRVRDAHPSFLLLLGELFRQLDIDPESIETDFDWEETCEQLASLDDKRQGLALEVAQIAAVLPGSPGRRQRAMMREAFAACGRDFEKGALRQVHTRLIEGQGIVGLSDT